MGCCSTTQEERDAARKAKGFPIDFDNEVEGKNGRHCVDIIPFFMFVIFCLAECYFGYTAFSNGEPNRLLYSVDVRGNLCGSSKAVNLRQFNEDPNLPKEVMDFRDKWVRDTTKFKHFYTFSATSGDSKTRSGVRTYGVCVEKCFAPEYSEDAAKVATLDYGYGYLNLAAYFNDDGEELPGGKQPGKFADVIKAPVTDEADWKAVLEQDAKDGKSQDDKGKDIVSKCAFSYWNGTAIRFLSSFGGRCIRPVLPNAKFYSACVPTPAGMDNLDAEYYKADNTSTGADMNGARAGANATSNGTDTNTLERAIADMYVSFPYIIGALAIAMALGFVYLLLLYYCAKPVVYSSILLCILICLAAGSIVLGWAAGRCPEGEYLRDGRTKGTCVASVKVSCNKNMADSYTVVGYIWYALALLIICVVCFMWSRIQQALGLVCEATKAVADMPMMVVYPLTTWVGFMACTMLCTFIMVFLVSCATYSWEMNAYSFNGDLQNLMWIQVFAFLWFTTFVGDTCTLVLCICYAEWYFFAFYPTRTEENNGEPLMITSKVDGANAEAPSTSAYRISYEDPKAVSWVENDPKRGVNTSKITSMEWLAPNARDDRDQLGALSPQFPGVCKSLCKVLKYYMGTVAFGSLIVAIVKFIQIWFEYVRRQTDNVDNAVTRCLKCCIACMISCLVNCLEFITYGAYIQVAINGTSFCTSALRFVAVTMENAGLLVTVSAIGGAVTFLGKIFVTMLTTMIMFVMLFELEQNGEISSYYAPLFVVFIGAYFSACMFMNVYDAGIDTLLQCAVEDLAHQMERPECMAKDDDKDMPRFMGPDLLAAFGETSDKAGGGCCGSSAEKPAEQKQNPASSGAEMGDKV